MLTLYGTEEKNVLKKCLKYHIYDYYATQKIKKLLKKINFFYKLI
jgi:hypothetical protein